MSSGGTISVFVSHSSRDAELAKAIADLFRAALRLSAKQIRCTSVHGYKLDAGADTNQHLRRETVEAEVLIGLITEVSVESAYVQFELGARWGANKYLAPVLGAGHGAEILAGPLSGINALTCAREDIFQLVDNVATQLAIISEPANSYSALVDNVVAVNGALAAQRGLSSKSDSRSDHGETFSTNISDFECDYLMTMSRPRNNGKIYGGVDDHEGREAAKYQEALEHFQVLTLVTYKRGNYCLTTNGWKLADQLWRLKVLDVLNLDGTTEDTEIAKATELTDGEAELNEVRRHLDELENRELIKTTKTRGGWRAWLTSAGDTHRKHRPLSIRAEDE